MIIFLSLVGFGSLIAFGIYSFGVMGQNRLLRKENAKLLRENEELRDLLVLPSGSSSKQLP
jgi:hypothetical protein